MVWVGGKNGQKREVKKCISNFKGHKKGKTEKKMVYDEWLHKEVWNRKGGSKRTDLFVLSYFILLSLCGTSRQQMVKNLLQPYENRAWAQNNWVLVRFWKGCGFGFRYTKSPHMTNKFGPKPPNSDNTNFTQSTGWYSWYLFYVIINPFLLSEANI